MTEEQEVPQKISQLVKQSLSIQYMVLEHVLLDEIDDLTSFHSQAERPKGELASRSICTRIGSENLRKVLLLIHDCWVLVSFLLPVHGVCLPLNYYKLDTRRVSRQPGAIGPQAGDLDMDSGEMVLFLLLQDLDRCLPG